LSEIRTLLSRSGVSLAVRVAGLALSFPATILLSRLLGIQAFGAYSIALSYASIGAIAVRLGFDNTATKFVSVYRQDGAGRPLRAFFRYALGVMALAWLAVVAGASLWVAATDASAPLLLLAGGAALVTLALALLGVLSAVLRAFDHIFESQFYEQLLRPLLIIALLVLAWAAGTTLDATLAMAITAASLLAATLLALWRSLPLISRVPPVGEVEGQRALWVRMGWVVALMSVVLETLNQIEVILLGALATNADSAMFAAAQRLSSLAILGMTAIVTVTGPRIAAAFHGGDLEGLAKLARVSARLCFGSALGLAAGLVVAGRWLLQLWGPDFAAAAPVLNILLFGALANAATGSAGYLTILTGHERVAFAILTITLVLTVALEWVLIPLHGAVGAAIGSAFGLTLWNVLMSLYVRRTLGIDCTVFGRPLRPPLQS
jgi:O-antigen/teichoic acid export membrane protein